MYPVEIITANEKAWYLRNILGYDYQRIGETLAKEVTIHEKRQKETAQGKNDIST